MTILQGKGKLIGKGLQCAHVTFQLGNLVMIKSYKFDNIEVFVVTVEHLAGRGFTSDFSANSFITCVYEKIV